MVYPRYSDRTNLFLREKKRGVVGHVMRKLSHYFADKYDEHKRKCNNLWPLAQALAR